MVLNKEQRSHEVTKRSLENQVMRSNEGWLAGVCEGLAETYNVSAGWVRLAWLMSILFLGFGFFAYIVAAFCLPVRGRDQEHAPKKLLGVCYRMAKHFSIDVGLVRIGMVLVAIGSLGTTGLAYIVLHFLIPEGDSYPQPFSKEQ